MKRILLTLTILALWVGVASAQNSPAGSIGLFDDKGGANCNVFDMTPGFFSIEVVHVFHLGATAVEFAAVWPGCNGGTVHVGDTPRPIGVTIGNSQTGVSVGYGQCVPFTASALTMNFFNIGVNSETCCTYSVGVHPGTGVVTMVDCGQVLRVPTTGSANINPDSGCMCDIATHETTWGHIKAIYGQ